MPKIFNPVKKVLSQIVVATLGLWFSTIFVPGVTLVLRPESNFFGIRLTAEWQIFLVLGIVLGLLNYFVRPLLDIITLPLKIITLGLFSFVIGMTLVWVTDALFIEFSTPFLYPLLWTTLIIWGLNVTINLLLSEKE